MRKRQEVLLREAGLDLFNLPILLKQVGHPGEVVNLGGVLWWVDGRYEGDVEASVVARVSQMEAQMLDHVLADQVW